MPLLLLLGLFVAMWFITIRPQQQRLRAQRALISSIEPGDQVITAGGLIGTITAVDGQEVRLDLGGGITVRLTRSAVSARFSPEPEPPAIEP